MVAWLFVLAIVITGAFALIREAYNLYRQEYERRTKEVADLERKVIEANGTWVTQSRAIEARTAEQEAALRTEITRLESRLQARTNHEAVVRRLVEFRDDGRRIWADLQYSGTMHADLPPVEQSRGAVTLWRFQVLVYLEENLQSEKGAAFSEIGDFDETNFPEVSQREALRRYLGWHMEKLSRIIENFAPISGYG